MEPTETFKVDSTSQVNTYLDSRGFNLFKTLQPHLKKVLTSKTASVDSDWQKSQIEENWVVRVKEIRDIANDYCQYEIYSEIICPDEEQLQKLQSEAQVFCYPKIMEYQEGDKI